MSIRTVLPVASRRLVTIGAGAPVIDAANLLSRENSSLVVVCDSSGAMAGVITKADIVRQLGSCAGCGCTAMVADIMTRAVVACHPDDDIAEVWKTMRCNKLKQMPIRDDDARPVGLLYVDDALQAMLQAADHEKRLLRGYIDGVGYH